MSNTNWIAAILIDLKLQVVLNYNATTKKHEEVHIMLMKRYIRKTISNHEAATEYQQALNAIQEKVLVEYVQ